MLEQGQLTGAAWCRDVASYLVGVYHDGSPSGQGLADGGFAGAKSSRKANPQHVCTIAGLHSAIPLLIARGQ